MVDMDMVDMDMAMAKDLQRLSQAMDIPAMDMVMVMAMADMGLIMARDLLRLSQAMDIPAMDMVMDMDMVDMDMVTIVDMGITKYISSVLIGQEFRRLL